MQEAASDAFRRIIASHTTQIKTDRLNNNSAASNEGDVLVVREMLAAILTNITDAETDVGERFSPDTFKLKVSPFYLQSPHSHGSKHSLMLSTICQQNFYATPYCQLPSAALRRVLCKSVKPLLNYWRSLRINSTVICTITVHSATVSAMHSLQRLRGNCTLCTAPLPRRQRDRSCRHVSTIGHCCESLRVNCLIVIRFSVQFCSPSKRADAFLPTIIELCRDEDATVRDSAYYTIGACFESFDASTLQGTILPLLRQCTEARIKGADPSLPAIAQNLVPWCYALKGMIEVKTIPLKPRSYRHSHSCGRRLVHHRICDARAVGHH